MNREEFSALRVGDLVDSLLNEVMCRQGRQRVLATYEHPVTGRWLWLERDDGVVSSYCADFWELAV